MKWSRSSENKKEVICYEPFAMGKARIVCGRRTVRYSRHQDSEQSGCNATAAVLRAKESVMDTVTTVRENCDDILSDAKEINAERAAADDRNVIGDAAEIADASAEATEE